MKRVPSRCKIVSRAEFSLSSMPPSVNHYWNLFCIKGTVRMVLSSAATEFRNTVQGDVIIAGSPRVEGRLAVELTLHHKANFAFDVDNFAKSCIDALMHAQVFEDDKQIDKLTIVRGAKRPPHGAVDVVIEQIENEATLLDG